LYTAWSGQAPIPPAWRATFNDAVDMSLGHERLLSRSIVRAMADFVEALSLAALVAATLEYAIVLRHREERRDGARWQVEYRDSLMSLGSVGPAPPRHWTDEGTRFRVDR
jgi:hypothetical protein